MSIRHTPAYIEKIFNVESRIILLRSTTPSACYFLLLLEVMNYVHSNAAKLFLTTYLKCNFSMNPHVRLSVGDWSVGRSFARL